MSDAVDVSVVMPAYDEAANLEPLLNRVEAVMAGLGRSYEIVVVDNGSRDDSPAILERMQEKIRRLRVITLSRNFGYDGAITAGLEHARGNWIVVMDGDQQDPPEEIPRFLAKADEGFPIVYGIREKRTEGLVLGALMKLYYRLWRSIASIDVPRDAGNFGVMSREVVDVINGMSERNKFIRGLRAWTGFRGVGLVYQRDDRRLGVTKFSFGAYLSHALNGIAGFSTIPLRIFTYAGLLGIVFCVIATLALAFLKAKEIAGDPVLPYEIASGFTTLAMLILLATSVILLGLGIIGEYVGRCLEEVQRRPHYIVKHVSGR